MIKLFIFKVEKKAEIVVVKMLDDARDPKGEKVPSHESGHYFVGKEDHNKGTVECHHLFTSAKANKITGTPNPIISDINIKGQDKVQRMAEIGTGRLLLTEEANKTYKKVPEAADYLKSPDVYAKIQEQLDAHTQAQPKKHLTTRPHKDDPSLYTEDGYTHKEAETQSRGPGSWDEVFKETPKAPSTIVEEDRIPYDKNPIEEVD